MAEMRSGRYTEAIARQACKVWRIRQALASAELQLAAMCQHAPPYLHDDQVEGL